MFVHCDYGDMPTNDNSSLITQVLKHDNESALGQLVHTSSYDVDQPIQSQSCYNTVLSLSNVELNQLHDLQQRKDVDFDKLDESDYIQLGEKILLIDNDSDSDSYGYGYDVYW